MTPSRILVCGPRNWPNSEAIHDTLDLLWPKGATLISGCAPGVDSISIDWARANKAPIDPYPADWIGHGKSAGFVRNQRMLKEGKPDEVWGFQPKERDTPGTAQMLRISQSAGIKIRVIRF